MIFLRVGPRKRTCPSSCAPWMPVSPRPCCSSLTKGKKDSEIYNKANVSRQHFSKIRNNPDYKPTKATAIAFAIALELNMDQTRDLIGRAGYALTTSSKFDLIIMYFIQNHNYNMFDINETLYEFDQILLGT